MPAKISLIGLTFGRLKVIADAGRRRLLNGESCRYSLCQCECGKPCTVRNGGLRSGNTRSCGCLHTESVRMIHEPAEVRFWKKVSKSDGCWNWTAHRNKSGYGVFLKAKKKLILSHRFSYLIHRGEIPDGMKVLHHCDNPACVNPDHLWLGTIRENNDDCQRKGRRRGAPGERNSHAKLTWCQVVEIRKLAESCVLRMELATRFGICRAQVANIISGDQWKELSP